MPKDYYKILGVDKSASEEEIRRAFQKLAHQYHPDKPGGNEAKFKEINEAYQVVGNAEKRKQFDQYGADFDQQGGFGGGMNWEDFMRASRSQGGTNFGGDFGGFDLNDIFGEMFGFGGQRSQSRSRARGRDIQVDIEIEFKDAIFGVEREISLRRQTKCDVCGGTGAEPGTKTEKCHTCGGQGQVVRAQRTILGNIQTVATCPDCHGSGELITKKCHPCNGNGVVAKQTSIKAKIPGGIDDGESIRLSGQGEAVPHGDAGDLYVRVHVRSLQGFERDGFDVYTETEINFVQAVLGDTIEIESLDGKIKLVIPEGTESGQLIRLRGKGSYQVGKSSRGDLYVKVKIKIPKKVNRELKKKLTDLKGEL